MAFTEPRHRSDRRFNAVDPGQDQAFPKRNDMHRYRFLCTKGPGGSGLFCTDSVSPPTSLRSVSLLQADCPERVLKPAGLGILSQRQPRCLAALCTGKFLGRYGGAIYRPAGPADDDQNMNRNGPRWSG